MYSGSTQGVIERVINVCYYHYYYLSIFKILMLNMEANVTCMGSFLMFLQTEQMLKTAERLLGKYEWGQYDLLVLPPSFPYGGMENPCLTFVTPTLLVICLCWWCQLY